MAKGPNFTGFGGYGPWPDNDPPFENVPGGEHYEDAYRHRGPSGTLIENPSDYWLDCAIYPDRPQPMNDAQADSLDMRARAFRISVGNVTGWRHGPSED